MKKGKVKTLTLSHKNGNKVLRSGDVVSESDVTNFMELVSKDFIEPDAATKKEIEAESKKAKQEKKAEKSE